MGSIVPITDHLKLHRLIRVVPVGVVLEVVRHVGARQPQKIKLRIPKNDMGGFSYILIFAVLIIGAIVWGLKRKKTISVSDFWQEKESEYSEKRILSSFARYLGGHARFENSTEGLLFLMSKSLWFENFEKGANIFGFAFPFEKVIIRIPLSRIGQTKTVAEKELVSRGILHPNVNVRRINRKPEYLSVGYIDEWGREKELFFDSMIDLPLWHQAVKAALDDYIPNEEEAKIGTCPKCGKKVSPEFKLCPYCGCRLS